MSLPHIEPGGPLRPRKDPHTNGMQRAGGDRGLFAALCIAALLFALAFVDYIDRGNPEVHASAQPQPSKLAGSTNERTR